MPILPLGSCEITVTEAEIVTLCLEGLSFYDENDPDPENGMQSDGFLPNPSSLTFGFHVVDPWCWSGNFLVGKARLNLTLIPRI